MQQGKEGSSIEKFCSLPDTHIPRVRRACLQAPVSLVWGKSAGNVGCPLPAYSRAWLTLVPGLHCARPRGPGDVEEKPRRGE